MPTRPEEIFKSLSAEDQELMKEVLAIENTSLHISELRKNSPEETEIINKLSSVINKAVNNAN